MLETSGELFIIVFTLESGRDVEPPGDAMLMMVIF